MTLTPPPSFEILTGRSSAHLAAIDERCFSGQRFLFHQACLSDVMHLLDELKMAQQSLPKKNLSFDLVCSFRSYERQLQIWNEKILGIRPLRGKQGEQLDPKNYSPDELIDLLLLWTHLPGSSRHHWGTDFDWYSPKQYRERGHRLQLITQEYTATAGESADLYSWMQQQKDHHPALKAFYWPYPQPLESAVLSTSAAMAPPIQPEPWHLSHRLQSQYMHKFYTEEIFLRNLQEAPDLLLREQLLKRADQLYDQLFPSSH